MEAAGPLTRDLRAEREIAQRLDQGGEENELLFAEAP